MRLVLFAVVVVTIYVAMVQQAVPVSGTDTGKLHLAGATSLVTSGEYRITQRTPLYPLFLAAVAKIMGTPAEPTTKAAREMGNRERLDVSTAFLGGPYLSALLWAQYLLWLLTLGFTTAILKMTDTLTSRAILLFCVPSSWLMVTFVHDLVLAHTALLSGVLCFVIAYAQHPKRLPFLLSAMFFALASLARPTYQVLNIFMVIVMFLPILKDHGKQWAIRFAAYNAVMWLLIVGGWSLYNYSKNDVYGVSSASGVALSTKTGLFLDRAAEIYPEEISAFLKIRDDLIMHSESRSSALLGDQASLWLMDNRGLTYAQASRVLTRINIIAISKAPLQYCWEVGKGMLAFFFPSVPGWSIPLRLAVTVAEVSAVILFLGFVAIWLSMHFLRWRGSSVITKWSKQDTIVLLAVALFVYTFLVASCVDLGKSHNRVPVQFVIPLAVALIGRRVAGIEQNRAQDEARKIQYRRMKVIIFSSEFPPGPGGLGTHAYYLSKSLSEKGWRVVVVTPQDYASAAEVADFNRAQAFPVVTLPSGRVAIIELFHRLKVLARQLKNMNPDVVVASGERAVWLAALVCFLTSRRFVVVGHGTEYGTASGWRPFLTQLALNRADLVIAVSNFTHDLVKKLGASPRRMTVIPNGADSDVFTRLPADQVIEFKRKIGMHDRHIVLTVGQVTERKGQEVIIRALPQILNSIPDTHYVMAGLPTGKEGLVSLAKELGIQEHVHFAGRVSRQELVLYMNICDVFAMTSRMTSSGDCEGYGIAAVEAALCGKPAVVSGESGLAEAIVDGETGIVVPPNDVPATSAALIRLLSDRNLRKRMGENAQARALREQTWCRRGAEMESALRGLVESEHIVAENLTHTV